MTDLVPLLQEFYRDKLASLRRHEASARIVSRSDANNAYQYVINRDEVQLSWLAAALAVLGSPVDEADRGPLDAGERASERASRATGTAAVTAVLQEDARDSQAFVERWRSRVEAMENARHRGMLRVILGEALEQERTFEQALAGRTDLLGRHPEHAEPSVGRVLPTRWVG